MKSIAILIVSCLSNISPIAGESFITSKELKLELIQVLFRHGARTPHKIELKNTNFTLAQMYEPLVLGELTPQGKQQEYEFGKFLRKRYDSYLGSIYKPKDVYAYSCSQSRTQMSLQLVLAGLYPPSDLATWNPGLKWSPIPYVTLPEKLDILLESHQRPVYQTHLIQAQSSDEFQKKLAKYSDFFKFVEERTMVRSFVPSITAHWTFDILIANEHMNLPLPDWYTPNVRKTFIEVEEILGDSVFTTSLLKKMGPGPLIKTFVENMDLKGTFENPKKIYLYSGHDVNIAMFIRANNITNSHYPQFGSALIVEKLKDHEDRIYVRFLFWDGAGSLVALKLNNKEYCPIEEYLKIVKDVMPSEEEIKQMFSNK